MVCNQTRCDCSGLKGDRGDPGPPGIIGLQGDYGDDGPEGRLGISGEIGDWGEKGDVGDKGERVNSKAVELINYCSKIHVICIKYLFLQGADGLYGVRGYTGPQVNWHFYLIFCLLLFHFS